MASIFDIMLDEYYPHKYALRTRFEDCYPGYPYERPTVEYYPLEEFAERFGFQPEFAEAVGAVQPMNENVIGINMMYAYPRIPYSLDPSAATIAKLMYHEGAHAWQQHIPEEEKKMLTEYARKAWYEEEETSPWIKGLLQKGYTPAPFIYGGAIDPEYFKTLWMEAMAHAAVPGGYKYRKRQDDKEEPGIYMPVELPEIFTPYLERLQELQGSIP